MAQITITNLAATINYEVTTPASTGPFAFPFEWYNEEDITVYINDVLLAAGNYTVATTGGTVRDDGTIGGQITLDTGVTNSTVTIKLSVLATKDTNFAPGQLDIALLNTITSRFFSVLRTQDELLGRAVVNIPSGDGLVLPAPADRIGQFLAFDATDGTTLTASATVPPSTVVSTLGQALIDDTTTAAMVATLELSDLAQTQHNLTATTKPGATDDSAAGYGLGSWWLNTISTRSYVCIDATATAAKWREAHLQLLNNGDLLTYSGATTVPISIGTAGQKLISDGTAPVWTNSGWEYVDKLDAFDGTTQAEFTDLDADYDHSFEFRNIRGEGSGAGYTFLCRTSTTNGTGGTPYDLGASDYEGRTGFHASNTSTMTGFQVGGTAFNISASDVRTGNDADGFYGTLMMYDVGASKYQHMYIMGRTYDADTFSYHNHGWGVRTSNTAVDAVQFLMGSEQIASGAIYHYRRKVGS